MRRIASFVDHQSSKNLAIEYRGANYREFRDLTEYDYQWSLYSHLEETGVLSCVVPDFAGRSLAERFRVLAAAREAWFKIAEETGAPTWALPDLFRIHMVRPLVGANNNEPKVRPFFVDLSPEGLGLDQALEVWFKGVIGGTMDSNTRPEGLEDHTDLMLPILFRSNPDDVHAREWVLLAETLRRVSELTGLAFYARGFGECVPGGLRFEGGRCYKAAFDLPSFAVPIMFEAKSLPLLLEPDAVWDVVDHPAQYGDSTWGHSLERLLRSRSQALAWKRTDPWDEVASEVASLLTRLDLKEPAARMALRATWAGTDHWETITAPMIDLIEKSGGHVDPETTEAIRLPEILLAMVLKGQPQAVDLNSCYPQSLDYTPMSSVKEMLGSTIPSDQMSLDGNWVMVFSQGEGMGLLRARRSNGKTPEQPVVMDTRIRYQKVKSHNRHLPPTNRYWNLVRQGSIGIS